NRRVAVHTSAAQFAAVRPTCIQGYLDKLSLDLRLPLVGNLPFTGALGNGPSERLTWFVERSLYGLDGGGSHELAVGT
ncbi:MAG: hypothetical protein ACE5M4_11990, partial [Anaerolineales bacterium]